MFAKAVEEKMDVGVYSINSPTPDGGARLGLQVPMTQYEEAKAMLPDFSGKLGPITGSRSSRAPEPKKEKEKVKEPRAVKVKKEKPRVGVCPACNEKKKDVPDHIKRRHPDWKGATSVGEDPSDSGDADSDGGEQPAADASAAQGDEASNESGEAEEGDAEESEGEEDSGDEDED